MIVECELELDQKGMEFAGVRTVELVGFTLHTGMNFTAPKIYENSLCKWEECKRIWRP
jgi:hypothetical protein